MDFEGIHMEIDEEVPPPACRSLARAALLACLRILVPLPPNLAGGVRKLGPEVEGVKGILIRIPYEPYKLVLTDPGVAINRSRCSNQPFPV